MSWLVILFLLAMLTIQLVYDVDLFRFGGDK